MGKMIRLLAAVVGVLLIAAQFVPVERSNPPVVSALVAPPAVLSVLQQSCFDCHSHRTEWPWYSRVAPLSWVIARHVEEGRRDLNFSDWPLFDFEAQQIIRREVADAVDKGTMPLGQYTWLHPAAKLGEEERAVLLDWAGEGITGR